MKSIGTIQYRDNWWIWVIVDDQLGKYLRKLFYLARNRCEKLGNPSQGNHITVVSSHEKTENFEKFWKKYQGEPVEFEVILEPDTNSNAWWFPIKSTKLEDIREELGLPRQRIYNDLHYCPGYERMGNDYEPR